MRQEGELLTDVVLVGSIMPIHAAIQVVTLSRHAHIYFKTSAGRVIDSSARHGGVAAHPPDFALFPWEYSRTLLHYYTLGDVERMTARAFACHGIAYDFPASYLINRVSDRWEKRLWCFEFAAVVMDDYLAFDHRPDRAVGRHWLQALKQLR